MITVKEFVKKYDIHIYYANDRNIVEKYGDNEVIAYAVSDFGNAFIFQSARKYVAFTNGQRTRLVSKIVEMIRNAKLDVKVPPKELERFAMMSAI